MTRRGPPRSGTTAPAGRTGGGGAGTVRSLLLDQRQLLLRALRSDGLNVVIDSNGPLVGGGFSTLVFEPVYNPAQGPVVSGAWQHWDADGDGVWWSTRPIGGQCAGATPACDRTWAEIVAANPEATVLGGVGVNQGSGNAGLTGFVDGVVFDDIRLDFERIRDLDGDGVADTPAPTGTDRRRPVQAGRLGGLQQPVVPQPG